MEEMGEVVELREANLALVQFKRSPICKNCNVCYLAAPSKELMLTEARNEIKASIGDKVRVEVEPKSILTAAFIIYTIPVIFFILGYIAGFFLSLAITQLRNISETIGVILAFIAFGFSFLFIRLIDRRAKASKEFKPIIREIVE